MSFKGKFAQYLITAIATLTLAAFIFKYNDDFYKLRDISLLQLVLLFILTVATIAINGVKLKLITRTFNITLNFKEWFGLSSLSISLNSLLFKTGSIITSNYLKRTHGFTYMNYVGTFGVDLLITLSINAWVGLLASCYLLFLGKGDYTLMTAGFIAVIAVLFLLMNNTFSFKKREHRIIDALARALSSLNNLLQDKKSFWGLCFLGVVLMLVTALRFYVSGTVLRLDIPLSHCFLFVIVITVIRYIPMIQNDIGTRELGVGLLSEFLGNGMKEGFLVTVVDRLFVLFWCLVFAFFYKNILTEKKRVK